MPDQVTSTQKYGRVTRSLTAIAWSASILEILITGSLADAGKDGVART